MNDVKRPASADENGMMHWSDCELIVLKAAVGENLDEQCAIAGPVMRLRKKLTSANSELTQLRALAEGMAGALDGLRTWTAARIHNPKHEGFIEPLTVADQSLSAYRQAYPKEEGV